MDLSSERQEPGGRRTTDIGDLTLVCDIGRPDWPVKTLGFPCLIVAWSTPGDWDFDTPEPLWPQAERTYEIREERLFWWLRDVGDSNAIERENRQLPANEAAWYYVLPLTAVSNSRALERLVVQPPLRLLTGRSLDPV